MGYKMHRCCTYRGNRVPFSTYPFYSSTKFRAVSQRTSAPLRIRRSKSCLCVPLQGLILLVNLATCTATMQLGFSISRPGQPRACDRKPTTISSPSTLNVSQFTLSSTAAAGHRSLGPTLSTLYRCQSQRQSEGGRAEGDGGQVWHRRKVSFFLLFIYNAVGREAIEGLRFLASLPRAGAGARKRNLSIGSIPVCLLRYAL